MGIGVGVVEVEVDKNLSRAKKIKSVIKKTKSSDQKFVVVVEKCDQ